MSKYADIEQIKEVIRTEWVKYMPMDLDVNLSFVLGKIAEVPTIEVSEDCISREDFLKTIDDNVSHQYSDTYETYGLDLWALFVRMVKNAPSVVPSRAEGEWKLTINDDYRCTACGLITSYYKANYCPNCGAKMKGADDD